MKLHLSFLFPKFDNIWHKCAIIKHLIFLFSFSMCDINEASAQLLKLPKVLKKIEEKSKQINKVIDGVDKIIHPQTNQKTPTNTSIPNKPTSIGTNSTEEQITSLPVNPPYFFEGLAPKIDFPLLGARGANSLIVVSPDDKWIVGLFGKKVIFMDTKTGKIQAIVNTGDKIEKNEGFQLNYKFQFSRDGTQLALISPAFEVGTANDNKASYIHIIRLSDFKVIFSVEGEKSGITSVSPNFKYAVTQSYRDGNRFYDTWDINTGKKLISINPPGYLSAILAYSSTFTNNDQNLIISGSDGFTEIDILSGNVLKIDEKYKERGFFDLSFSENNELLILGGTLKINYESGSEMSPDMSPSAGFNYCYYENKKKVLVNYNGYKLALQDVETGKILKSFDTKVPLVYVAVSNSGKTFFGYTFEGEYLIGDSIDALFNLTAQKGIVLKNANPVSACFTKEEDAIFLGFNGGNIKNLNLNTGKLTDVMTIPYTPIAMWYNGPVLLAQYDTDSKLIGTKIQSSDDQIPFSSIQENRNYYAMAYSLDVVQKTYVSKKVLIGTQEFHLERVKGYYGRLNSSKRMFIKSESGGATLQFVTVTGEIKDAGFSLSSMKDKEIMLRFLPDSPNDYLVMAADGRFGGTDQAIKQLMVKIENNLAIEFDFRQSPKYSPNLFVELMQANIGTLIKKQ